MKTMKMITTDNNNLIEMNSKCQNQGSKNSKNHSSRQIPKRASMFQVKDPYRLTIQMPFPEIKLNPEKELKMATKIKIKVKGKTTDT